MLGGHAVARTLREAGCDVVFTLCGGHVAPIYDGCVEYGIDIVDTRHEQGAVHAADAHARLSRGLGVAVLTAGPGITDGVTGIANAQFANSPVLILGGAPKQTQLGRGALQEMDQLSMLRPITKGTFSVTHPDRLSETVGQAIQLALADNPGPVFVEIPFDVVASATEVLTLHQARYRPLPQGADPAAVERLAEVLCASARPILFAGSSVWWDDAGDAVMALAAHGVPVLANGMARGVLPPDHPSSFSLARSKALRECDLLLLVGAPLDFRIGYGQGIHADAHICHVNRDPRVFGKNRDTTLSLHADARSTLTALIAALAPRRPDAGRLAEWRASLRAEEEARLAPMTRWAADESGPVNHFRLARAIAEAADDDTIIVGDGGDVVSMAARWLRPRKMGRWLDPGPFGTLGVGAPFALAAKRLRPGSQVILLSGDGSFGLTGFDVETCVRFNLPVTVVIGNDAAWGQIRVPQIAAFGAGRAVGSKLAPIRYDEVVRAFGGAGEHVGSGNGLDAALRRARDSHKVYALDVALDPGFIEREKLSKFTVL